MGLFGKSFEQQVKDAIDQINSKICGAIASRQKPSTNRVFRVAVAEWPIVSAMHVSSATRKSRALLF